MDNVPASVFFKDTESRFIVINEVCAKKFRLDDPADAVGKTDFDFFAYEHAAPAFADEQRILKTLVPIIDKEELEVYSNNEQTISWTSTSKFPLFDDEGVLIGTYGISKDITETKLHFKEIKRLKNQMENILNAVPNLIFVKDVDGRFIMANQAAKQFLDPEDRGLIGKTDGDLGVPPEEAEHYRKTEKQVLSTNRSQFYPEILVHNPDGAEVWHQFTKVPLFNSRTGKKAVLTVVTDVSKRIEYEIDLTESLQTISKQNERLSNFAHIVSHNLRNHAGGITSLVELLEMVNSPKEQNELFELLHIASNRLNETIVDLNEIMDKQNKDAVETRDLDFQEYLNNITEVLTSEIVEKQVNISEDIQPGLHIHYNAAYLESILLNLISNAIKYRHPERVPEIFIKAEEADDTVKLTISDNGLGIDLKTHGDKLFGMYKTFHNNKNAKGIGLYITRNQIEALGGTIRVESNVNTGSTFYVDFGKAVRRPILV